MQWAASLANVRGPLVAIIEKRKVSLNFNDGLHQHAKKGTTFAVHALLKCRDGNAFSDLSAVIFHCHVPLIKVANFGQLEKLNDFHAFGLSAWIDLPISEA